tara:strand:- start:591 stop:1679 length:1089 start_codon:yes stop_codon:yes gene_type:complete
MAKSVTTMLNIAFKKLVGKVHTSPIKGDADESVASNVQLSATSIFADTIPTAPSTAPNRSGGNFICLDKDGNQTTDASKAVVEYIDTFTLVQDPNSVYEADSSTNELVPGERGDSQRNASQDSGVHAYSLKLPTDYTSNSIIDLPAITTHGIAGITGSNAIQIVPTTFGNNYAIELFEDDGTQIPLLSSVDWSFDPFSGFLHLQDFESGTIPATAKAYLYVGKYQKDKDMADHTNSATIAKQKLFSAYTFNQEATFIKASGSSFVGNDLGSDKGTYYFLNDQVIIGSEQVFANGLLQQSSSRGKGDSTGQINDYLAYASSSNETLTGGIEVPQNSTIFEFTYPVSSSRLDGKVLVTYLAKDS